MTTPDSLDNLQTEYMYGLKHVQYVVFYIFVNFALLLVCVQIFYFA